MDTESVLTLARRWLENIGYEDQMNGHNPQEEARSALVAITAVLERRPKWKRPEALLSWLREVAG